MAEPALKQAFRDAVINVAKPAVFFVDPTRLTNDPDYNARDIGKQFKEQFPNEKGFDLNDPSHVKFAQELADQAAEGPTATSPRNRPFAQEKCIVSDLPAEGWNTKQEIVSNISGIPERHLRDVPGTTADYVKQTAEHEAFHCNQDAPQPGSTHKDKMVRETGAQDGSKANLKAEGKDGVLKTIEDAETVQGVHDTAHATNMKLNQDGTLDNKDYQGAMQVKHSIYFGMADKVGIKSEAELQKMEMDKPNMYTKLLKGMVKEGVYDQVPDQKARIEKYVDAREALIKPDADTTIVSKLDSDKPKVETPKVDAAATP